MEQNLLNICIFSFASVLAVLLFLAVAMRVLIFLFPAEEEGTDATVIAAIGSAYAATYPRMKIIKIEEGKEEV